MIFKPGGSIREKIVKALTFTLDEVKNEHEDKWDGEEQNHEHKQEYNFFLLEHFPHEIAIGVIDNAVDVVGDEDSEKVTQLNPYNRYVRSRKTNL